MDDTLAPPAPASGDVLRTPLVERIRAARPAIVALVAPAGFGKSTLVRQLLADYPAHGVCDCRGVGSDVELARRLLPALADENPERSLSLSQSETIIGDGHGSAADRVEVAVAAWRVRGGPSAFVLENGEDALRDPGARAFLARLLANRPEGRTIVICSREPLRVHLSRFAPPHQILSLRADDLAFRPAEIAAVLAPAGAAPGAIERVAAISGGWPIAVLLLARFAAEGRLEPLLDRLDDVAYEELHEYLADQVLGNAPPAVTDALLACAAMPQAGERDVRLAIGDAGYEAFAEFQKTSPFVTRDGAGTFTVHPLVASTLGERHPARIDALLAPVAAAYATAGEFQRAAEIQLARGDQLAAATALERVEVIEDAAPPIAYARVLASLDRPVVMRFPRLWAVTAMLRTFSVDSRAMLEEAEAIWQRLPPDAPPIERIYLYVFRVMFMSYLGEFERALALVDDFRAQIAAPDVPTTRMHAWLLYLRSLMTARMGRLREAERDLEAAWPFINAMHVMGSGTLATLGADVARVRGDRRTEREKLARALEHSRKSGLSNFIARDEAEAAFGAWLAGDDADYTQHGFALEAEVAREGVRGFAFFVACMRGHERAPEPTDNVKWVACGHLIAAATGDDGPARLQHAELAREAAAFYRSPFGQVLAALALAELDPARQRALRAEAAAIAQRIDAPTLHEALAALGRGEDGGFLAPFVRRYRTSPPAPGTGLVVELVTGRVLRDGVPLTLAEREHALLVAVAMRPEALTRERLTDMLWPDLGESAARNAFHVCLHRLKSRLADEGAVVRTREGYRLGSDVRVDLWEIDRTLGQLRSVGAGRLDARQTAALRALYDGVRAARPAKFAAWEWFEPTERHLCELRCELAQALANAALDEGRPQDALALALEMIAYDACDEPARELAIRAYLESGDRAAALRHFRQYRDTLEAELQCEPSEALAKLVGATS